MKILITGGASGIGKSMVENLIAEHEITVLDRNSLQLDKVKYVSVDLSSIEEIDKFFLRSDEKYDALINAAGIREIVPPHELEVNEWGRVLNINVTAPFILSKHLIKDALADNKKLSIINIASVSGLLGEPDRAAYVTSKHAIIGLTKQLAFQYGKYGIRVNAIAPGIIETPLTAPYFTDPITLDLIKKNTPVAHWGQPDHLNSLIDICLENDFMTGSVLVCDGGWSCGKAL
ncbi:MAG: SDR family NAD(P)-dependent oxidoreductase [Gammaproteobacteria bacterium]|nr:SDR family NAD(P)-dependent oxidoreductase [Gammaproteobacteria bacterium]